MQTYQGTFRKLIVWQVAKELAKEVYRIANKFPSEEKFGLCSQMKRAAISIMSNLAEGNQRNTRKDSLNFFNIAFSSLTELDNQGEVAYELGYVTKADYEKLIELINKDGYLIFRLIESNKNPNSPNSLNSPKSPNGFSLVELMVVVAIIAIMSVAGVVGFKYMGDTMRTKEVAGVITDTVKKAELEILKNDYKKSTIHFLQNYLVIVSEPETASLNLDYGSGCLTTTESGSQNLIKEDGEGNLLEATTVSNPIAGTVCAGFTDPNKETEWQYQLRTGGKVSAVVRFVHFNLNRVEPSEITLSADTSQTLVIEAPYAKKTVTGSDSTVSLTLTSPEGHTETLTIQ